MPICDPFWTEKNGGCSDELGRYVDLKTDAAIVPNRDLTSVLTHVSALLGGEGSSSPNAAAPFNLGVWLGTGYNLIYLALGLVALLFVLNSMKGGRR